MTEPTKEDLLAHLLDLKIAMPPRATIRHRTQENHEWLGRAKSLIKFWDPSRYLYFQNAVLQLSTNSAPLAESAYQIISTTVN